MKMSSFLSQENKKMSKSNRIKRTATDLIGFILYPIVYPIVKINEIVNDKKVLYWKNNLDKLKEKSISEAIQHIEKEIVRQSRFGSVNQYTIYNSGFSDEIHYSNAFYLKDFIGTGFHYRVKDNEISKRYHSLKNEERFHIEDKVDYDEIFNTIKQYFQNKYEDIEIIEGQELAIIGGQKYFKIKFSK